MEREAFSRVVQSGQGTSPGHGGRSSV